MAESLDPKPQAAPGVYDPAIAKKGINPIPPTSSHSPSQQLLRYFKYDHLPQPLQDLSYRCASLAKYMESTLPEGPEKTMGLRKLLEAKDCFVRAALPQEGDAYIGKPGEAYKDIDIAVEGS